MDWGEIEKLLNSSHLDEKHKDILKSFRSEVVGKGLREVCGMLDVAELQEKVLPLLKKIVEANGLEGAFIMDAEGLPLISHSNAGIPEDTFAASCASIMASTQMIASDVGKENVNRVIMETDKGPLMFSQTGDYIVALVATPDVKLGILRALAQQVEEVLRS